MHMTHHIYCLQLISFFEICAHPHHSSERVHSTMSMLDSLIRTLSLTHVDRGNPRVSTFVSQLVPTISPTSHSQHPVNSWDTPVSPLHSNTPSAHCNCTSFTLGRNNVVAQQTTPLWLTTPAWGENWTEAEVIREECRRVVWSSVTLSAGHSSYTAAGGGFAQMDLFINDPSNVGYSDEIKV